MKRVLLHIGALSLLLLANRGTDIGSLRPVEVVQLTEHRGILIMKTDTGDCGWGMTVEQAVEKLKETTPGSIYLDTADFLLLKDGLEVYIPQLGSYLKKNTRVVFTTENMNLQDAASYLRIHKPENVMKNLEKPEEQLVFEGGKLVLKKF